MTIQIVDALITYAWCRTAYVALRSLTRFGLRVAVADTGWMGMCQNSRYKNHTGIYRSPLEQPEIFVKDVVALLKDTGAHFLLPSHDETEVLARYRSMLPDHVILPVAHVEKIELANDKARMAEYGQRIGLSVPKMIAWQSLPELESALRGEFESLVVKLRRGNSAKGVYYPESSSVALNLCERLIARYSLSPERYPILQERVNGDGWGVSCLYWQGERLASFTHRRLREKTATGGTSTYRESRRNPVLEKQAHQLLDSLGWHGLAMVEFKYDPRTERSWLIEVNPRLWGSIHLAVTAGLDFPKLLYLAATDGPEAVHRLSPQQHDGITARWYLGDAIVAAGELSRGHILSAFKTLTPGGADTVDDWHWDDLGAFFGEAFYYLSQFFQTRSLNPELEGMLG